jgi:hypothetical protein
MLREVGGRMVGPGRAESAAAVGSLPVVVPGVPGEDQPQVWFTEDEHPVGELGSGGAHESFGVGVGPDRQLRLVQMTGTDVCG